MEILLDQMEEEGIVVNFGDANELEYQLVKDLNNFKIPSISDDKGKGTVIITLDSSFSLSKSQLDTVTELEVFIVKNANEIMIYKEGRNDNSYVLLMPAQEKQLKMQSENIFNLRKEMDSKQKTIDKLLKNLAVCLHRESLIRDENIFLLQSSKINSNTQNFHQSKLSATKDNKAINVNIVPLEKDNRESIDDKY